MTTASGSTNLTQSDTERIFSMTLQHFCSSDTSVLTKRTWCALKLESLVPIVAKTDSFLGYCTRDFMSQFWEKLKATDV